MHGVTVCDNKLPHRDNDLEGLVFIYDALNPFYEKNFPPLDIVAEQRSLLFADSPQRDFVWRTCDHGPVKTRGYDGAVQKLLRNLCTY